MNLAIPIWQKRVSPVFDTAEHLLILEISDGREVSRVTYPIGDLNPSLRAKRLAELHVDVLVCGAISRPLANMLFASGIRTIPWISGNVDDVIPHYLDGRPLDGRFLMPGCRRRQRLQGGCTRGLARHWAHYPEDML